MTPHPPGRIAVVVLIAVASGVMNAVAGGGTLLTFPALVALGIDPIVANATSTVALWPGTLSSMWGYRDAMRGSRAWATRWAAPCILGGLAGALLLLHTPASRFAQIVPWLVLAATGLFVGQRAILALVARLRADRVVRVVEDAPGRVLAPPAPVYLLFQLGVSIYGGYFGAGMGILMLAALGLMGLTDIHRMNGLKNWGGLCVNAVAVVVFAANGVVDWPVALAMAVGATVGGWAGARVAQRVPQRYVRRAIAAIGFGSAIWLLLAVSRRP